MSEAGNRDARILALYESALNLKAEQREAFLKNECGSDTALLEAVKALLELFEQIGPTTDTTLGPEPNPIPIGSFVDGYKIHERLGSGAFGEVFLAERRSPVRQWVALKALRPGMDSREVLTRCAAERQALAMLSHPGIVKVLDAGTTSTGRPYFVMEHVKGIPIDQHCDRHRLGVEQRLELFAQVCDAVQHAHQKGIVHRDLKPSNILVSFEDGQPMPHLIDFGVAKAMHQSLTDRTLMTRFGQVIGTLPYMAPEQLDATTQDIDTTADI